MAEISTANTTLHLIIHKLPANEEEPAEVLLKNLNSIDSEYVSIFHDTTGEAHEEIVLDLPQPTIARAHKIELQLKLTEVNLVKKLPFNLTDDGTYILISGDGGLRFKQRFDGNFGKEYELTKRSSHETSISENKKNFKRAGEKNYSKIVTGNSTETNKKDSTVEDLIKLAELRDSGILTEEEFAAKKKQILGI
ncbi:hypothetical protein ABK040_016589 [Willaertia magna]